jgi:D-alanyl-D-alanine carboxypeptidase/D-alanyl-D-alanine-endopeptidase (penicillin-binding protein 4)
VKKIEGCIVGDASYFDAAPTVRVWKPGMSVNCGPLSALSLNEGVEPNGRRAADPALYVATSLTALLRHGGIPVSGRPRVGTTPSIARLAHIERSAPLGAIVAVMNKSSDNFFAEMLTKGLGASFGGAGSTSAGVGVERAFLVSRGISPQSFALTDGSGLSYADRQTALDITDLLVAMAHSSEWPMFWRSLSVAGVDGTLAQRMRGSAAKGNLHAKTGTLTVASSLSGYVKSADGAWLAFSILMNKSPINVTAAHAAQDAIGVALARSRPPGGIAWTPSSVPSGVPAA